MPITQGGSDAISGCSLARVTLGWRSSGRADLVHPVHGENVLGEIDANVQNAHDFPFRMS